MGHISHLRSSSWQETLLRRVEEKIFKKAVNIVTVFQYMYYLPLEKDVDFSLNKLEFPSPKDAM